MDEMEMAYSKNLNETYTNIKKELCLKNNLSLESLIVQKKNQLMTVDQPFKTKISVINTSEWDDCAKRFMVALQNKFNYLTQKHYKVINSDNVLLPLYKEIANTAPPNCYNKKSPYITTNYPTLFQSYQKTIIKNLKTKERKQIKELHDNYLKQIQVIALMETLIELKSKIDHLQSSLRTTEPETPCLVIKRTDSEKKDTKVLELLDMFDSLSDNKKQDFYNEICQCMKAKKQ